MAKYSSIEEMLARVCLIRDQRDALNAELSELMDQLTYHNKRIGEVLEVLDREGIKPTTHSWV